MKNKLFHKFFIQMIKSLYTKSEVPQKNASIFKVAIIWETVFEQLILQSHYQRQKGFIVR